MKSYMMDERYRQYTYDESRLTGDCLSISFPETEAEIQEIVREMAAKEIPITIQGGLTGVVGGGVPFGGHTLNLSHMTRVLDYQECSGGAVMTVEPGITRMELQKEIGRFAGKAKLFWPPEPTASTATVGGIAANRSAGICSYYYGDTAKYIDFVRLICADGSVRTVRTDEEGELLSRLIGGEGAGGVFSAIGLRLIPRPESVWGICFFLKTEPELFTFVEGVRKIAESAGETPAAIAAIEFLDEATISLIAEQKLTVARLRDLPEFPVKAVGAVYLELHGQDDAIEALAGEILDLSAQCGCEDTDTWAVSGDAEVEKLREFRYSASEIVNTKIDEISRGFPGMTKLAADMRIPGVPFSEMYLRYKNDAAAAGIPCYIYGHAGENAFYANLMPDTPAGYEKSVALLREWAAWCISCGGNPAAEYGVGKLTAKLLYGLLPASRIQAAAQLQAQLDPQRLWNIHSMN